MPSSIVCSISLISSATFKSHAPSPYELLPLYITMASPYDASAVSIIFTINAPSKSSASIKLHALVYAPQETLVDGHNDRAPSIIALHYWGGSAPTFHHIPRLLQARQKLESPQSRTSIVILISHRGWGQSSLATPDVGSAYSTSALASDIIELLPQFRSLGLIPQAGYVLCGHSMGAKVALAVSQLIESSLPNDFPRLHGILPLAPAPPTPLILPDDMREQQIHAYESERSIEWTVRNVLTGSGGEQLYGGQDDLKLIVHDSLRGSEGAKQGWPGFAMGEKVDIRKVWTWHPKPRFRVLVSRDDPVETFDRVNRETVNCLLESGYGVDVRVLDSNDPRANGNDAIGHLLPIETPQAAAEELWELLRDIAVDQANI